MKKNKKWLVYIFTPIMVLMTLFLYVYFISDIKIIDIFNSIKLTLYIILGFTVLIAALHMILKKIFKEV